MVVGPPCAVFDRVRVAVLSVPLGAWQSQQERRKPQLVAVLMVPPVLLVVSVFHGGDIRALLAYELFCLPRIGWYEAFVVRNDALTSVTPPETLLATIPAPV